ncbi:hypothetical protein PG984_015652 [Apiospora sp. TS-2023a]
MLFRAALASAATLLFATQAIGAAIDTGSDLDARAVLIATDPYSACQCPKNCSHKAGSGCKYYKDHTNDSPVIDGRK